MKKEKVNENNIWFAADLHLNHDRDFIYNARGFDCVKDMNQALINNWNAVVQPEDIVYYLGDLCFGNDQKANIKLIKKLNGHIILIIGNHDTDNKIKYYEECPNIETITYAYRFKYRKRVYWLSHYPTITGNTGKERPVWCLSGHTHNIEKFDEELPYNYCVCVDAHSLFPVSLAEVESDIRFYTINNIYKIEGEL